MLKVSSKDALVITTAPFASSALIDLFVRCDEEGIVLDENEVLFLEVVDDHICDVLLELHFLNQKYL